MRVIQSPGLLRLGRDTITMIVQIRYMCNWAARREPTAPPTPRAQLQPTIFSAQNVANSLVANRCSASEDNPAPCPQDKSKHVL